LLLAMTLMCLLMLQVWQDTTSTGMWIATDGASVDYGEINADEDFYDPEDEPLFMSDEEPDAEQYEGYTGNAGKGVDCVDAVKAATSEPDAQFVGSDCAQLFMSEEEPDAEQHEGYTGNAGKGADCVDSVRSGAFKHLHTKFLRSNDYSDSQHFQGYIGSRT
jgi:hypothetical protein